ncbi:MAG: GatB/YqeY domain-containing protein [Gammaproteobacteria bacterium]|nr:GatB/YqeY domain-containing protein [Gammaproteobacteria bacterium]
MASPLKEQLSQDVKTALKGGDKERVAALRFTLAAVKQQEVDTRTELDDTAVVAILTKLANQRKESLSQFEQAGREDLAAKERYELGILQTYLPQPLGEAEIDALIGEALTATGASSAKDMGKVMTALRPQLVGRADLAAVSTKVKQRLAG